VKTQAAASFSVGTRVRVSGGSGVDSGKEGIVVSRQEVKTDGRGVPTNVPGCYKPVDWSREVAIRMDDESLMTMFKNRLTEIPPIAHWDGEPPMPPDIDRLKWASFLPRLKACLQVLRDANCRLLTYNPSDAFYNYITVEYERSRFRLGLGSDLGDPVAIKAFLELWPSVIEFVDKQRDQETVWYSDINHFVKSLGYPKGRNLAYKVICELLRQSEIVVHS